MDWAFYPAAICANSQGLGFKQLFAVVKQVLLGNSRTATEGLLEHEPACLGPSHLTISEGMQATSKKWLDATAKPKTILSKEKFTH